MSKRIYTKKSERLADRVIIAKNAVRVYDMKYLLTLITLLSVLINGEIVYPHHILKESVCVHLTC